MNYKLPGDHKATVWQETQELAETKPVLLDADK
jgi:hypothetical protein